MAITVLGFLRVVCEDESIFICRHWDNVERQEECQTLTTAYYVSELFYILVLTKYRVIHKSLRDFRTRLRNNQDRHGRKEHINRQRISPKFFFVLGALAYFQVPPLWGSRDEKWRSQ